MKKYAFAIALAWILTYLTFAFVQMEFNPKAWGIDTRVGMCLLGFMFSLLSIPAIELSKEIK